MSATLPKLPADTDDIVSPCTGVCALGPHSLCIGCLRSSEEIGNWLGLSPAQRRRIMAELPSRLEQLFSI